MSSPVLSSPLGSSDPASLPDGTMPAVHPSQKLVTVAIVAGPLIALALVVPWLGGVRST